MNFPMRCAVRLGGGVLVPDELDRLQGFTAGSMLWAYEGQRIATPKAFIPRRELIECHNDAVFFRSV